LLSFSTKRKQPDSTSNKKIVFFPHLINITSKIYTEFI